jgi:hypothetical protein
MFDDTNRVDTRGGYVVGSASFVPYETTMLRVPETEPRLVPRYPTVAAQAPLKLIGLCGLAGCGKSTVAAYLENELGYARVRFAGPLKDMLRALGLSERHIEGDLKEVPCELLGGKTPRQAMQSLGTEWGRDMVADDLWIRAWADRLPVGPVVAEDVRFPNEAAAIREKGGLLIRITGRGGIAGGHASEANRLDVDVEIENTGSLAQLKARAGFYATQEGWSVQ